MGKREISEDEVMEVMKRFQKAFESGDKEFFDYFSDDMTIFSLSSPTRIDGLEVYRHGFETAFSGKTRKSQLLSPEIRILGPEAALMTFHNRVLVGGVSTNMRGTVVFVRDEKDGRLKCVHMHNSPLSAPSTPLPEGKDLEDVTLLEERIASAVAMVGTPK